MTGAVNFMLPIAWCALRGSRCSPARGSVPAPIEWPFLCHHRSRNPATLYFSDACHVSRVDRLRTYRSFVALYCVPSAAVTNFGTFAMVVSVD